MPNTSSISTATWSEVTGRDQFRFLKRLDVMSPG
jgi:hypothetical protein